MAPVSNKRVILKAYTTGSPVPGQATQFDATQKIDLETVPLKGGVLLKILVLSLEPYILVRMNPQSPNRYKIGETIEGYGISVVVRSENSAFQVGDHLSGVHPFEEYSVQHETASFTKIHNEHNLSWTVFVGIAGMPGQTAYFGWKEFSHAKKGEVVFVSSGAGGVGSTVIQFAKRDGLKVIASAGSDDQIQYLKELGTDVAFNYKTTKISDILAKEGPINIYWDNVGGETLEAALDGAAQYARFIECGMTANFTGAAKPISNLVNVIAHQISMYGLVGATLAPKYLKSFEQEVPALLASKKLIYKEHVTRGLENAEAAFIAFLKGAFVGKSVVVLADN